MIILDYLSEPYIQYGVPFSEAEKTQRHREGGLLKVEAEMGVMQPQARNSWVHQKLKEATKDSPL